MLLLLFPAFAASPFANTAEAVAALRTATTMVSLTPPEFVADGGSPRCENGKVHAGPLPEEGWKDASYALANAWADCLLAASYDARQLPAEQRAPLRSELTVALLRKMVDNGRFPADAVGGGTDLTLVADSISRTASDSEIAEEVLKEVPELSATEVDRGTAYKYQGKTWIFQTYPWTSWVVDLGIPASSTEAFKLVYQGNLRLTDLRLYLDADGKLLLESPRLTSPIEGTILVSFQDFVQKAEPLLPALEQFAAGTLTADAVLGGWK